MIYFQITSHHSPSSMYTRIVRGLLRQFVFPRDAYSLIADSRRPCSFYTTFKNYGDYLKLKTYPNPYSKCGSIFQRSTLRLPHLLIVRNCSNISKRKIPAKSELKRLLQLATPEKWSLIGATFLLLISSSVTMAIPFCIGKIIDIMSSTSPAEIKEKLNTICQILIAVFLVGGAANFGRTYLMNVSGQKVINRLRILLYDSILKQEIGFFDKVKTGELVNRLSTDTSVVGYAVTMNISDGLRSSFAVIAGISMMVYTSPGLAFIGLSIVPPVAIGAIIYGRYLRSITKSVQDSLARATQVADEHISNIRTVRAFAQEQFESLAYQEKINHVLELATKESLARAVFYGCAGLSGNMVILTVLYYGGTMMSNLEITIGSLGAFLMYASYVGIYLGGLSSFYAETMRALGASTRIWELIDRQPLIPIQGGVIPSSLFGEVKFDSVSFVYPNRLDAQILQDFSLDIQSGQVVAIVGVSGSGKSTLASLILRLYDPISGTILLDGQDIKTLDPLWLRRNIGLVSQEPVLFSGSIHQNVLYGLLQHESLEKDRLEWVLKEANAWEFVQNFPLGSETVVGERGVMLSGGQRQRIAIARALLKDPKILILDEATSALDAHSEHLVQEALDRLMLGRTVITIAHRLSTIRKANRIAVLDKGIVAEIGSYSELMALPNGQFKALIERQLVKS